jgi:acyl-CoA reductase-like NAD-dependent aldehyde dehydrogenase
VQATKLMTGSGEIMTRWSEQPWKLLIGGSWVDGDEGSIAIINPATEEIVGHAPEASVAQARAAAKAAQDAFPAWSATPAAERAALLRAAADRLDSLSDDLLPLIVSETGATLHIGASVQVGYAVERMRTYADDASKPLDFPMAPRASHATTFAPGSLMCAHVNRLPVGAVACISPYNFPLVNMVGKVAPALAVGCTVVMKPPVQNPLAILVFAQVLHDVGFPPGVVNVVSSAATGPAVALTDDPNIDMVSFTGSSAIGARIYESGAPTMKRMLLELGGKGACIVLDDGDVDRAVEALTNTWTYHSGQTCTTPTRAIVHRSKYDELMGKLSALASTYPVGDPLDPRTVVGPVISAAHRDRILDLVTQGQAEGAELVVDGRSPAGIDRGFYVGPTLLGGCTSSMAPVRNELFGPVVAAIAFDDDDEAISITNDTEFGLYNYLMTNDAARAFQTAKRIRSNVSINTVKRSMHAPFGGFKMSGIGRDGGDYSLLAYTEMQAVQWEV